MAGFWYPYIDQLDALKHLQAFADQTIGPGGGISFSNGSAIAVLRLPHGSKSVWLNVLSCHIAVPRLTSRPPPPTAWQRVQKWFEQAVTMSGELERRRLESDLAVSRAVGGYVTQNVWEPAHQWLLRHKLFADGLGVAADVVGVVAGAVFVVMLAPEIGTGAVVVGSLAFVGSIFLLGIDGSVFGTEISGHEEISKRIEDSSAAQWVRIIATLMTMPDMAVGGVRALKEFGKLNAEALEATLAARAAQEASEAQRARAARISHPAKHPGAVQKHLGKARRFSQEALHQAQIAEHAAVKARVVAARDLSSSYGATPVGAALVLGSPPGVVLSDSQKQRDNQLMQKLAPVGGMPRDVRLDMRVSVLNRVNTQ